MFLISAVVCRCTPLSLWIFNPQRIIFGICKPVPILDKDLITIKLFSFDLGTGLTNPLRRLLMPEIFSLHCFFDIFFPDYEIPKTFSRFFVFGIIGKNWFKGFQYFIFGKGFTI